MLLLPVPKGSHNHFAAVQGYNLLYIRGQQLAVQVPFCNSWYSLDETLFRASGGSIAIAGPSLIHEDVALVHVGGVVLG